MWRGGVSDSTDNNHAMSSGPLVLHARGAVFTNAFTTPPGRRARNSSVPKLQVDNLPVQYSTARPMPRLTNNQLKPRRLITQPYYANRPPLQSDNCQFARETNCHKLSLMSCGQSQNVIILLVLWIVAFCDGQKNGCGFQKVLGITGQLLYF